MQYVVSEAGRRRRIQSAAQTAPPATPQASSAAKTYVELAGSGLITTESQVARAPTQGQSRWR